MYSAGLYRRWWLGLNAALLIDAQAELGECAIWCDITQNLYWTDIEGSAIFRWQMSSGEVRRWSLPDRVGCFALCTRPTQLLLGLSHGVALFDMEREVLSPVVPVEPENPTTRINDGRCDRQGRFVFGMYNQAADKAPIGHFYRVDADLNVERLPLPAVATANSIAFSPDGDLIYFTDTPTRQIHRAAYFADGRIGAPEPFVVLSAEDTGNPDGAAIDADGGLWSARWGGSSVVRYDSIGKETDRIDVPVSQATCPAFGGPDLNRLFITTARTGLDAAALEGEPAAGGVFSVAPGWRGLPESRFVSTKQP